MSDQPPRDRENQKQQPESGEQPAPQPPPEPVPPPAEGSLDPYQPAPPRYESWQPPRGGEEAMWTLIGALLFLYFGFFNPFVPLQNLALYNISLVIFEWMCRIVGIGYAVIAAMHFARRGAPQLDLVISSIATVSLVLVGGIWLYHGFRLNGILLIIFGIINGMGAGRALTHLRAGAAR